MAKRSAIPEDNREYPEYEYREFPKFIGGDEYGNPLIAQRAEEVEDLERLKVYPKAVGLNRDGKTVFVNHPDEEVLRMGEVVRPLEKTPTPPSGLIPGRPAAGDVNPETGKPYTAAALKKAQESWDAESRPPK